MKAQEVLRRYAAGDRNFCNANLRGANFRGQDLSGADFSGADIRSANFSNAILRGAIFNDAKAGLQRRWLAVQWLVIALFAAVSGALQDYAAAFSISFVENLMSFDDFSTFDHFSSPSSLVEQAIGGVIYLLLVIVIYAVITLQGFSIKAFALIVTAFALTFTFMGVFAFADADVFADAVAFAFAGALAVAVAFAFSIIVAVAIVFEDAVVVAIVVTITAATAIVFKDAIAVVVEVAVADPLLLENATATAIVFAIAVSTVGFLSSFYVGWQVRTENEKFAIVRLFCLALSTIGGTFFCGADLTGAAFIKAVLKSTNFANSQQRKTICTHVCWQGANNLNRARLGSSILQDYSVRTLLTIPEKGYKQDFTDANLRGANLCGVTLEHSILKRAVLSNALLRDVVLEGAILTEAQAVNADFTGARLTGATLESWNIDSTTTLKNIDCRYVFLRETPDEKGSRERRPHNPDKIFQPGDFEKFFKEMFDEVQILIRNGIDPISFRAAMSNIMQQNPDITQDSIKAYEKQGDDVLLTLQVPPETDKGKLERDWDSGYQTGLKAGREASQLESGPKFEKLAFLLAEKSVTNIQRTEVMTGNDQSQNVDVKGDFTVTANNSVVSLRDISGQVKNQIGELSDEPTQAQLKGMLSKLQAAIEVEPELSEEAKTEALEEVKQIAAAGRSLQDGPMKKAAKRAITVLKGMTMGLGETTKFVEVCNGLLPAIALLFGL